MYRILYSILFCGVFSNVMAQDVHLSQFYTNQQNLNPALSGNYNGAYRVAANHRNQWQQIGANPIVTTMLAFDQKLYFRSDEIDAGIIVIHDQFSAYKINTDKILLTGSYKKVINSHEIRAGVQFGMTLKSSNLSSQTFPNQWVYSSGDFDQGVDNRESTLNESQRFIDLNVGIAWSKAFNRFKPTAGISFFHINNPKDSYFKDKAAQLKMRPAFHAEVVVELNNSIQLEPKLLYMWTTKTQNALIGGNIKKQFYEDFVLQNAYGGLLYRDGFGRNSDAIIPVIGLSYKNIDVGISYDINIADLSAYSNRKGTLEFSLIYTAPAFIPKKMSIPCDRY